MTEEVIVGWKRGKGHCGWHKTLQPNTPTSEHWLCEVQLCIIMKNNWALSGDQCQHGSFHLWHILLVCWTYFPDVADHQTMTISWQVWSLSWLSLFAIYNQYVGYMAHSNQEMVCCKEWKRTAVQSAVSFFCYFLAFDFCQLLRASAY